MLTFLGTSEDLRKQEWTWSVLFILFLGIVFTLYPSAEASDDVKVTLRNRINSAWGEIYNQLGRNKTAPLNDDEFLRAHWIMYFKYSREKGDDYIRFLLDDYFSPKKVIKGVDISTRFISNVEEVSDLAEGDDDLVDKSAIPVDSDIGKPSILKISEINSYVESIRVASKVWYSTFFPQNANEFSTREKVILEKLNRLKVGYFRPLIMSGLLKTQNDDEIRMKLLQQIERFIFLTFRVSRAQSNFGSSYYSRAARSIYFGERTVEQIIKDLNEDLEWVFDENGAFKVIYFQGFIDKKFAKNGLGFYGWSDLRYFLFEYEEHLKQTRNQPKLGWENFIKHEKDKVSIEHIYPQNDSNIYWVERFGDYSEQQRNHLKGSLGNLLPLSSSINSSLQNDDFLAKKKIKQDDAGVVLRNGYSNGSYSELEVASADEWASKEIVERGMKLLGFMEQRWEIDLGDRSNKLKLLQLSFLDNLEHH